MDRQTIKTIMRADGRRRVDIIRRDDGFFSFVEMAHYQGPYGDFWAPLGPYATIVDSPDAAEREARASVLWLIGMSNKDTAGKT